MGWFFIFANTFRTSNNSPEKIIVPMALRLSVIGAHSGLLEPMMGAANIATAISATCPEVFMTKEDHG